MNKFTTKSDKRYHDLERKAFIFFGIIIAIFLGAMVYGLTVMIYNAFNTEDTSINFTTIAPNSYVTDAVSSNQDYVTREKNNPTISNIITGESLILINQGIISQSGEHCFITSHSHGFSVIDLADMTVVGQLDDSRRLSVAGGLIESVNEDWVYVLGYISNSFNIIDISDKRSPYIVKSFISYEIDHPKAIVESWDGQYVYILSNGEEAKITVLDVSNINDIEIVGKVESYLFENATSMVISKSKSVIYIASYLYSSIVAIDVSNSTDPTITVQIQNRFKLMYPSSLAISNNEKYLYVSGNSHVDNAMATIDVSDSKDMYILNSLNLPYESCFCCPYYSGKAQCADPCLCGRDYFRLDVSTDDTFVIMVSSKTQSIFRIDVSNKNTIYASGALTDILEDGLYLQQVAIAPDDKSAIILSLNSIVTIDI